MTFDPKKWIQEAWNANETKSVNLAGEEIVIRRLTGTQWEHYVRAVNGKSDDSSVVVMLQHGLVKTFGQYTYEEMAKFYDACPVLADKIAAAILEHTLERMDAEQKVLEDAEKNSAVTTTPSPTDDGVESTDKTRKPQK
jgi:hypothetical protein